MTHDDLLLLADRHHAYTGLADATIAKKLGSHARLFQRLRDGRGCNVNTYNAVMQRFSDIWPADLEWPASIPRPKKQKDAA